MPKYVVEHMCDVSESGFCLYEGYDLVEAKRIARVHRWDSGYVMIDVYIDGKIVDVVTDFD